MDAWKWAERRQYEMGAWMLSHLLAPYSKKALRPQQFLGEPPKNEKMDELIQRMEKRAAQ